MTVRTKRDRGPSYMVDRSAPSEKRTSWEDVWHLDPSYTFLNHGSYGATPRQVLERQQSLRLCLESEPVRFFNREIEPLMANARQRLAEFIGADPAGLVFVTNATTGVNTVLKSLDFRPGDEILTTDHVYNACNNAAIYVAQKTGAKVTTVHVPFPIGSADVVTEITATWRAPVP